MTSSMEDMGDESGGMVNKFYPMDIKDIQG